MLLQQARTHFLLFVLLHKLKTLRLSHTNATDPFSISLSASQSTCLHPALPLSSIQSQQGAVLSGPLRAVCFACSMRYMSEQLSMAFLGLFSQHQSAFTGHNGRRGFVMCHCVCALALTESVWWSEWCLRSFCYRPKWDFSVFVCAPMLLKWFGVIWGFYLGKHCKHPEIKSRVVWSSSQDPQLRQVANGLFGGFMSWLVNYSVSYIKL